MGFSKSSKSIVAASLICSPLLGCGPEKNARVVPALEYSQSVKEGTQESFSFFDIAQKRQAEEEARAKLEQNPDGARGLLSNSPAQKEQGNVQIRQMVPEAEKLKERGFQVQKSIEVPESESTRLMQEEYLKIKASMAPPPAGSSAPYYNGQMTANSSLWPDESQQSSLFRDLRAFQPMDVVTIVISESVEGQKRTQTDSQSRFSILAAISNLFGFLSPQGDSPQGKWNSNNPGMDPENLINAETNSVYQGTGQTRRLGSLKGKLSAMVLEVLPNGLLRLEGTKIISVDHEEEVMVVSGLARLRDIDPLNQLDSSRIANMRIDFYGKGVVGDTTNLGWGTRIIRSVWPF